MPELPEVETVLRTLEHQIKDDVITGIHVRYAKTITGDPELFQEQLINHRFAGFERRGKYLLFDMEDCILCVHLRMEGKFFIQKPEEKTDRHMHVLFDLASGRQLRYHDTRKFGRMEILPKDIDLNSFHGLGPEPFSEEFNEAYVYACCHRHDKPIKSLLLEQDFVAGIGNIYASEILYACHIRPGRSCKRITHREAALIVEETRRILAMAIAAGGTTIRSYTSSLGVTGLFQLECKAYGQRECPECHHAIHIKMIGGRSSYYCPVCQK